MDKSPESRIAWHQDRIKSHRQGFVGPGITAITIGLVMPRIGYLENPNSLVDHVGAAVEYSMVVFGGILTAVGMREIGVQQGQIDEIKRQNQLDQG